MTACDYNQQIPITIKFYNIEQLEFSMRYMKQITKNL